MRMLSLDLATTLGWAFGDTETGDPVSGTKKLPSTGDELGPYLAAYGQWLMPVLKEREPQVIVFESPIMPGIGTTTISTLLKLYNLIGTTERAAYALGIKCRQVSSAEWKKGFCGSARFGKSAKPYPPIVRCGQLGWTVKDHNEADACGIWVHACRFFSPGAVARFDPLFRKAAA